MTRADFVGGLLLSAFFGATLWGWSFQYGAELRPGRVCPVWLSATGLAVSLLIAAHGLWAMRGRTSSRNPRWRSRPGARRVDLRPGRDGSSHGAARARHSILLFLVFLTLVVQRLGVAVGIGASVGTVVFVYVVFVYFLEVPIPKGPLGF
jgi:hypothetical protein